MSLKPRLVPTHGVYNPESKKATTSCLRINAYCYYCKKADSKTTFGKYSITVNQSDEFDIMKVEVKHSEHNHQAILAKSSSFQSAITSSSSSSATSDSESNEIMLNPVKPPSEFNIRSIHQISGSEREKVAEDIRLNFRGSAKAYRLALIARNSLNIASEDVYRKILQQYSNKEDISVNWQINLIIFNNLII